MFRGKTALSQNILPAPHNLKRRKPPKPFAAIRGAVLRCRGGACPARMGSTETSDVTIRSFQHGDAAAAFDLAKSSPEASQWSQNTYENLSEMSAIGWVAESNKTLQGFLIARILAPEAEILNIVVSPAQRRKGLATSLLSTLEVQLRNDNTTRIFLEVRESNLHAIAFYAKHAFARTGIRQGYYLNPTESAVLMEKELTG